MLAITRGLAFVIRNSLKLIMMIFFYFLIFGANVVISLLIGIETVKAMSDQTRNLYFALPAIFGGIVLGRYFFNRFSLAHKIDGLLSVASNHVDEQSKT